MKCPECGYNTFDHLQSCRKCGSDLTEFKTRFGLRGFPAAETGPPGSPARLFSAEEPEKIPQQPTAAGTADFGFEFLESPETGDPGELRLEDLLAPAAAAADAAVPELFNWPPHTATDEGISGALPANMPPEEKTAGVDSALPAESTDTAPPDLPFLPQEISSGSSGETEALRLEDCDLEPFELPSLDAFEPAVFPLADGPSPEGPEGDCVWPAEPATGETGESEAAAAPFREPVPLARRAAAGLADLVILGALFILFVIAGEFALGGTEPLAESFLDLVIPYFLVFFCLCFGYFTLFHFLLGQTPGKMLFGLRVTAQGGESLLFSQAFLRSTGGLLSLLPAGIGFLLIFFDRQGRGWNDRLAGTRVIRLADQSLAQETS